MGAPLHRESARVVGRVAAVAAGLCLVLAAVYVASGRGWLDARLAGITLAMALLPEEPALLAGALPVLFVGAIGSRMRAAEPACPLL